MDKSIAIRTGRHCVFNMHVHLVFVTKYRKRVFTPEALATLKPIFEKICADSEAVLEAFNGETEHVHLLIAYPPKVSVAKLVNSLKGASSRLLKKYHPDLVDHYYQNQLWSPSYFASSCGGAPLSIIKQYIDDQEAPQ